MLNLFYCFVASATVAAAAADDKDDGGGDYLKNVCIATAFIFKTFWCNYWLTSFTNIKQILVSKLRISDLVIS